MSELRECPRCKGSVSLQRFNVHPSLKARIICSCGIEMRASKRDSVEDLIERWNTRAERTCKQIYPNDSDFRKNPVARCSECMRPLVKYESGELANFCHFCGARVVVE